VAVLQDKHSTVSIHRWWYFSSNRRSRIKESNKTNSEWKPNHGGRRGGWVSWHKHRNTV